MKSVKKAVSFAAFFMMFFLFAMNVSAASGWSTGGDTKTENGVYILTEKYHTSSVGTVIKNIPIDTRNGFTISFDYWVGDWSNQRREGFQLLFANKQLYRNGGSYFDRGYDEYQFSPEMIYRAVDFDSSAGSSGLIALAKNDGKYQTYVQSKAADICDGAWHNVVVTYKNGNIFVFRDGTLILSQTGYDLPYITYMGFTASTSYWGTQTTMLRKIILHAEEPSIITFNAVGGSVKPSEAYVLRNSNSSLPTPTKYGNTFLGWYTSLTGGTKIASTNYNFAAR